MRVSACTVVHAEAWKLQGWLKDAPLWKTLLIFSAMSSRAEVFSNMAMQLLDVSYVGGSPEGVPSMATEANFSRRRLQSATARESAVRNSLHRESEVNY